MSTRLGLDLGTNSIGWCLYDLDDAGNPCAIRDIGVRIFSDGRNPKDGSSLAVMRRLPRQMRRRRDRYLGRRERLMAALVRHGLMPADEKQRKGLLDTPAINKKGKAVRRTVDPYELRARGLDEAISPFELGRALFHLNQRRGFKSNRKTDKAGDADDNGKIKAAAGKLAAAITATGARTLGEYLHMRRAGGTDGKPLPVRARLNGVGAKAEYELYPTRDMIAAEFDALWAAQASYHPAVLTDAARSEIRDILFYQRPLKPVDPGRCTFHPDQPRVPWALPSAQRVRIYQELGNLRKIEPATQKGIALTTAERDLLAGELFKKDKRTFDQIRRMLKLDREWRFSHESEKRAHLDGDKTAHRLGHKNLFGAKWHAMDVDSQDAIVERLLEDENEGAVIAWLMAEHGVSPEAAVRIANCPLPTGYGNLGRTAIAGLLAAFRDDNITYDEACRRAGYPSHSDFRTGEVFDHLPYYGKMLERHVGFGTGDPRDTQEKRYGRIANPTVHIGLNQLRRVVNELARRHGAPKQIALEIARELKQSFRERQEIQKEQAENQRKNNERRKNLAELGVMDNGENRMRLRLWEELNPADPANRRCAYTGEVISCARLFSDEVEIDHILPFSRTLDNSAGNRIVSLRKANRIKTDRSPFEASEDFKRRLGAEWGDIMDRAQSLPKAKRWRFAPDAMDRYENGERGFLDRHLQETQYLSRIAKAYLGGLCGDDNVWVSPGRLTAMLRGLWGLNSILSDHNLKERSDHRHHAIDAAVIGVTDRSLLQRVATVAGRAELEGATRLLKDVPVPWEAFRDDLKMSVGEAVVSHKLDHGTQGALHEETAYGMVRDPAREDGATLVFRKPLTALTSGEIARIRDRRIRDEVEAAVRGLSGKEMQAALAEYGERTGTRRVRILKTEEGFVPIRNSQGTDYKAVIPGANCYLDIVETSDGKWIGEAVSYFDAARKDRTPSWSEAFPNARHVMRLFKGDAIWLDWQGARRIMKVYQLWKNRVFLAEHFEGGVLQTRHTDPQDGFRWAMPSFTTLQKANARKARIDEIGHVWDEGAKP